MKKDLLSISDLSSEGIRLLIAKAVNMKAHARESSLSRKVMALVFEKPSLRTRVSFEMAMRHLGGECIYLSPAEVGLGKRESVPDVARVLSRYVDVIAARASHETLQVLSANSSVPVINALSDREHPCQVLADLLTIYEKKGKLEGVTVAYVGDGNNVATSLLLASALTGVNIRLASPHGYAVQESVVEMAREYARRSGSQISCIEEPRSAVMDADVVYTDVWISMGQEAEAEQRRQAFAAYQLNGMLLSLAKEDAILMHPLPAHRGEEVDKDIIDCPQSVVFDQAENRLHIQKALLAGMLGGLEMSVG